MTHYQRLKAIFSPKDAKHYIRQAVRIAYISRVNTPFDQGLNKLLESAGVGLSAPGIALLREGVALLNELPLHAESPGELLEGVELVVETLTEQYWEALYLEL